MAEKRKDLYTDLRPYHSKGQVVGVEASLSGSLRLQLQRLIQTSQAPFIGLAQGSLVCNTTLGLDGRGEKAEQLEKYYFYNGPFDNGPEFPALLLLLVFVTSRVMSNKAYMWFLAIRKASKNTPGLLSQQCRGAYFRLVLKVLHQVCLEEWYETVVFDPLLRTVDDFKTASISR